MGQRPDDLSRDPLAGGGTDRDPLVDPAGTTGGEARPVTGPDPALGGGIGGGAVIDEGNVERDEIGRTRAEIERTRADMGETVDAIQQRLSPENLKEQAKDRVMEATVGRAQEAGSGIMETIRANPVPAALTGIGLTWLFASARSSSQSSGGPRHYRGTTTYDYPPSYTGERTSTTTSSNIPSAEEALGRTRDRVGESASRAQDRAGQVASQAQDRVSNLRDRAQYQSRRANDQLQRMLRQNPLTVGALAVGVGAAVGLALPQTRQEHEVMGEARDTLVEKAQEVAGEAQEKVQRVAQEAQSAAKDEAENQGLTGDQQQQ